MNKYTHLLMPKQTCELCPALVKSQAVKRGYRDGFRNAVEYLEDLLLQQQLGKLVTIDEDHVLDLRDDLMSLEHGEYKSE
jgi:hypothetical protein